MTVKLSARRVSFHAGILVLTRTRPAVSYSLTLGSSTIFMCILFTAFHLSDPSVLSTVMEIIQTPETFVSDNKIHKFLFRDCWNWPGFLGLCSAWKCLTLVFL